MVLRRVTMCVLAAAVAACGKSKSKAESGGDIAISADAAMLGTRRGPIGMTDHQVLTWLTEGHRAEVELADFAKERALDEALKSLATELRVDHLRLQRDGGMLVKQLNKPNTEDSAAAPQLDSLAADHARSMTALRALNGEALDRAIAKTLVSVHEKTLDSLRKWNGKALDPKLNAAIEKAMPITERHLVEATKIDERIKKTIKARTDSLKAVAAKLAKAQKDSLVKSARAAKDSTPDRKKP